MEIVEIKFGSKYLISVKGGLPKSEVDRLKEALNEWMKNREPFMILNGDLIKVVPIEDD